MDIGIAGLGRMGAGMAERWLRGGQRSSYLIAKRKM